jgi:aminopeptidase N
VNIDADRYLLADFTYDRSREELLYQYRRAPLFADRMDALQRLDQYIGDSIVFVQFRQAAFGDRSAFIRKYAISRLEKTSPSYSSDLKALLMRSFRADTVSGVRVAALAALNRRFLNDPEVTILNDNALTDAAPAICAEALNSISRRDPAAALRNSLRYSKDRSRDIIMAVTTLYGNHGDDGHIAFFRHSIPYVTGFDMLPFCASYGKLAQRCRMPGSVLTIATDLEGLGRGASKYTRYGVTKALKDLVAYSEQREALLKQKSASGQAGPEKEYRDFSELTVKLRALYDRARS